MFVVFRPFVWVGLTLVLSVNPAAADSDALRAFVDRKAGVLELLHSKAERALVTAGQDQTLSAYFEAQSEDERKRLRERIDQISLAVQERFAVEEMCLIDEHGAEISRIVGKEIAYDLATDEADAVFFAPGFAQKPRTVHISSIYLSPDAERWVTAYVTPVMADGETKAILHYEHGLDFYEKTLNARVDPKGQRVLLTVTTDGWIIFDSRKPIPIEKIGESTRAADYFEQFSFEGMNLEDVIRAAGGDREVGAGSITTPAGTSFDVAFKQVEDWILFAYEPSGPG